MAFVYCECPGSPPFFQIVANLVNSRITVLDHKFARLPILPMSESSLAILQEYIPTPYEYLNRPRSGNEFRLFTFSPNATDDDIHHSGKTAPRLIASSGQITREHYRTRIHSPSLWQRKRKLQPPRSPPEPQQTHKDNLRLSPS